MSNPFDDFATLPDELQKEAIREGEKLLDAQLAIATAADQRALTWAGFLVTAATAALGGGIALIKDTHPDTVLGVIAILFATILIFACGLALRTVAPKPYCLPGNEPGNWLPQHWDCTGTTAKKVEKARAEQAAQLHKFIRENSTQAKIRAADMRASFMLAFATVTLGALLLGGVLVYRACTVPEVAGKARTALPPKPINSERAPLAVPHQSHPTPCGRVLSRRVISQPCQASPG